jgi:hypothetical protein
MFMTLLISFSSNGIYVQVVCNLKGMQGMFQFAIGVNRCFEIFSFLNESSHLPLVYNYN